MSLKCFEGTNRKQKRRIQQSFQSSTTLAESEDTSISCQCHLICVSHGSAASKRSLYLRSYFVEGVIAPDTSQELHFGILRPCRQTKLRPSFITTRKPLVGSTPWGPVGRSRSEPHMALVGCKYRKRRPGKFWLVLLTKTTRSTRRGLVYLWNVFSLMYVRFWFDRSLARSMRSKTSLPQTLVYTETSLWLLVCLVARYKQLNFQVDSESSCLV
jgi:hypothetical protein